MTQEKDHARPTPPVPEPKPPDLPGPNREADITRVGEALAPGTVPEEERRKRERHGGDTVEPTAPGANRP